MKIVIIGRPASKKNNRRNYGHVSLPSEAYVSFNKDALYQLKKYKERFVGEIQVDYEFYQKGRMTQDVDNAICSINDCLQDAKIISDDKNIISGFFQVVRGSDEWRTEIYINEVEL